jgi:outer membrane protein assembly factor BamB
VRASDGHVIWTVQTHGLASGFSAGNFYSSPAVRYGRVYIGNTDNKVYSFSAATGQIAWTYTMPYWAYGSPGVADGRVYATSFDGTVVALGARDGHLIWRRKLRHGTLSSPTIVGKLVYVADLGPSRGAGGSMYAFDARTGRLRWRFHDGKYSGVIVAGNHLVAPGFTHLYIFRPKKR